MASQMERLRRLEQKVLLPAVARGYRKDAPAFDWEKIRLLFEEAPSRFENGWTEEKIEAFERYVECQDRLRDGFQN